MTQAGAVCSSQPAVLVLAAALSLAGAVRAQELQRRVESIVASAKIGAGRVGVSIIDAESQRVLAALRPNETFIPASNMKLLTTGAAMSVFAPDFTFRTEIAVDGRTLVIRGAGDPGLGDPALLQRAVPAMNVRRLVEALADAVQGAGTTRLDSIIVDDRVFDRQSVHPSWPADQLHKWYCAEVAGLNFHTNVLTFFPAPSAEGLDHQPSVVLEPEAPWIEIENKARTGARNANSVWVQRSPTLNAFTLFGEIGPGARVAADVSLHQVPVFFGQALAAELVKRGVSVGGTPGAAARERLSLAIQAVRLPQPGERLAGRTVAAVSTHVADVYQRTNADSQNLYAECLLKRLGHEVTGEPGSWASGSSVVRMTIAQVLGPDAAAATVVADGSGMSREDRVAPEVMARWLCAMQDSPRFGDAFVASMAEPGEGTLRSRFRNTRLASDLHAKSGKLDGVRCLSGYLTDPETGRRIAFSVLVNELREGEQALQSLRLHEEIVKAIDTWIASQRPAEPAVKGG